MNEDKKPFTFSGLMSQVKTNMMRKNQIESEMDREGGLALDYYYKAGKAHIAQLALGAGALLSALATGGLGVVNASEHDILAGAISAATMTVAMTAATFAKQWLGAKRDGHKEREQVLVKEHQDLDKSVAEAAEEILQSEGGEKYFSQEEQNIIACNEASKGVLSEKIEGHQEKKQELSSQKTKQEVAAAGSGIVGALLARFALEPGSEALAIGAGAAGAAAVYNLVKSFRTDKEIKSVQEEIEKFQGEIAGQNACTATVMEIKYTQMQAEGADFGEEESLECEVEEAQGPDGSSIIVEDVCDNVPLDEIFKPKADEAGKGNAVAEVEAEIAEDMAQG